MATLVQKTIAAAGSSVAMAAADIGGDEVAYANGARLIVANASGSPISVTMVSEFTAALGIVAADNVVTVAAGETAVIPLNSVYRDSSTSKVAWTYDDVTTVTVAVI